MIECINYTTVIDPKINGSLNGWMLNIHLIFGGSEFNGHFMPGLQIVNMSAGFPDSYRVEARCISSSQLYRSLTDGKFQAYGAEAIHIGLFSY